MKKSVWGVLFISLVFISSLILVSAASDSPRVLCKWFGWGCSDPQLSPGNVTAQKARPACSPNLPDLVISSVNARVYTEYDPEQNRTYNYAELTGVLSNIGCAATNMTSFEFDVIGVGEFGAAYPAPIAAGQTIPIGPMTFGGPVLAPGTYIVVTTADPWNEILESNENNNRRETNFTV